LWTRYCPAVHEIKHDGYWLSFLIDGEVVIISDDGTPDFHALRSKHRGHEAVLFAFDLIDHDGDDLRDLPLIERKRRLARLLGRSNRRIALGAPVKAKVDSAKINI
jgi:ATP-dependent DNA ligase